MELYFSCSLTGGRQDQPAYAALVAHLKALGHRVLTEHLASPAIEQEEGKASPKQIYERDMAWLWTCEALIAEVSTPSHGVGFEIASALGRGRPILCLARTDVRVSKMLTGIQHPGFVFRTYRTLEEAYGQMEAFLGEAERMTW